jgi:protein-L-isoaspartate(D-aspartate) O-methyltransferase
MASTANDAATRALRDQLVEHLSANGQIESAAVAQAFRDVPRHVFLPGVDRAAVYTDEAFPTKRDQHGRPISSSSQPAIMAVMLEQLAVAPGHHVLEIGAGTGYNAALLDRLVGSIGSVTTVDIDEDLVVGAREHLAAAHASRRVEVVHGDGGLGWPDRAPYDRIIVTVGAWDIPPAWTEQLARHGRLVLPLSLRTVQQSVAFEPVASHLTSVSIRGCGFMPMRGAFAGPETVITLDAETGLLLDDGGPRDLDIAALRTAVRNGGKDIPSGVHVTREDLWGGLSLWLTLHNSDVCRLIAVGAAADEGVVPALITKPGLSVTPALLGHDSLAALVRLDGDGSQRFELGVRPLGDDATPLAQRLLGRIRRWEAQGRPSAAQLNRSSPH